MAYAFEHSKGTLAGEEQKAIDLIVATVKAEPKWKENLSAFYCLYRYPAISSLYPEKRFNVIDWNNAISMLTDLGRNGQALSLTEKVLQQYPSSSYTWYLQAYAYQKIGYRTAARDACRNALQLDPENEDAKRLWKELDR